MAEGEDQRTTDNPLHRETTQEYNRVYSTYCLQNEVYCVPVDEEEHDRIRVQHGVLQQFFGEKLFYGGGIVNPRKVLDCGHGLGLWAVEDYEVTGVDLFPVDIPDIPSNLRLHCYDLNQKLTDAYPVNEFDIIQSRFLGPGMEKDRWLIYVQELLQLLKPGGLLQMVEYYFNFQSHTGLLEPSHALYDWGQKYRQAMERDRNPRIGSMSTLPNYMRAAGFSRVMHQNCSMPVSDWSRDEREKEIGRHNLENFDKMLDSFGTWAFRERLGMTEEEVIALNTRAKEEARNPRFKTYIPLTVAWARKPGAT